MPKKEVIAKYKKAGLCPTCGRTNDRKGYSCSICTDNKRKHSSTQRSKYKEENKCSRCSYPLDDLSTTSCQKCSTRRFTLPFGKFPNELEV